MLVLAVCAALAGMAAWPATVDDRAAGLLQRPVARADVVIVALDSALPDPARTWPRSELAMLIERLLAQQPNALVVDSPLSGHGDAAADSRLAALLSGPPAVIPTLPDAATPLPPALAAVARPGHGLLPRDADGRVRHYLPLLYDDTGTAWPALAVAATADAAPPTTGMPPARWRLPARAAEVPVYSARALLDRRAPLPPLRGRWIVVGPIQPGGAAVLPGPAGSAPRHPVQYQALALQALLDDAMLVPLPAPMQALLSIVLVLLVLLPAPPGRRWLPPAAGILATLALAWWLPRGPGLWFAPAATLVLQSLGLLACLVLQHPAWSGLAARRHLLARLRRLPVGGEGAHALLTIEPADDGRRTRRRWHCLVRLLPAHARRPADLVARLGPRRVALLLPATSHDAAQSILDAIRGEAAFAGPAHRDPPLQLHGRLWVCDGGGCGCIARLQTQGAGPRQRGRSGDAVPRGPG